MIKVTGEVIKGKEKGKNLGFPTANIKILEKLESGVYSGKTVISGRTYKSAIFIPSSGDMVESYILDFSGDVYGQMVDIKIGKKIREVKKFKSEEDLIAQIKKDIEVISKL